MFFCPCICWCIVQNTPPWSGRITSVSCILMQNSLLKYFPFLFSKSKQEKQYFFHMGPAATLTALTFSSGDVWMSRHIVHINSHSHTWAHCLELLMHRLVVCLPPPLPFYPAYCDLSTHSFFGVYAPFLHILWLISLIPVLFCLEGGVIIYHLAPETFLLSLSDTHFQHLLNLSLSFIKTSLLIFSQKSSFQFFLP